MMTDSATGAPCALLRPNGLAMLAAATATHAPTGQGSWLLAALLPGPDVVMPGYLAGPRIGAASDNLGHRSILPTLAGAGLWLAAPLVTAVALIWLARIGMDRALGYGLKYADSFHHTHLGGKGSER